MPNDQRRGRRVFKHVPLCKAIKMTSVCRLRAYCKHMDIHVVRPVESKTVKVFLLFPRIKPTVSVDLVWKSENCSMFVMSLNAVLLICELCDKIKGKCQHDCECKNRCVCILIEVSKKCMYIDGVRCQK